jgi:hypothetical protein
MAEAHGKAPLLRVRNTLKRGAFPWASVIRNLPFWGRHVLETCGAAAPSCYDFRASLSSTVSGFTPRCATTEAKHAMGFSVCMNPIADDGGGATISLSRQLFHIHEALPGYIFGQPVFAKHVSTLDALRHVVGACGGPEHCIGRASRSKLLSCIAPNSIERGAIRAQNSPQGARAEQKH